METGPTSERATDPRPARSRAAIVDAIGSVGDPLTVATLVAAAGVGRSTFYAHFRDLDDLAIRLLTEAFAAIGTLDLELRATMTPLETARETTRRLVTEFDERRDLYAAVLGPHLSAAAERAIRDAFAEHALETMRLAAPAGVDPIAAARYTAAGTLALLTDRLQSASPIDAATVQSQLLALLPSWLIDDAGSTTERNPEP